jgi:UDP-N-acetylmuramoyl-tripeptide--D-alanyl-D-alanine ligase
MPLRALAQKAAQVPTLLRSPAGRRKLVDRLHWRSLEFAARQYRRTLARRTRVVAVVGSFGKSTTSVALGAVLDVSVLWKVLHTKFRVAPAILRIRPWQRHAVLEIGLAGGPLQMPKNTRIARPDVVVFTCIGSEHNRTYGSLEQIRDAKARVLEGLREPGLVVLNADDVHLRAIAGMTKARVVTYGIGPADVRAVEVETQWPHGTRITVAVAEQSASFVVGFYGQVMVYPILAAIAVAMAEGYSLQHAIEKLRSVSALPGRLQPIRLESGVTVFSDEFKSTLETIDAAIDAIADLPGRKIIVLGEISEPPSSQGALYRRLGERLGPVAARVIIVGQRKVFLSYARGAKSSGVQIPFIHVRDVSDAIAAVRADLRDGDIVLVKGRSSQRLDRVVLALQGRNVGCRLTVCNEMTTRCDGCPKLATGLAATSALGAVLAPAIRQAHADRRQ